MSAITRPRAPTIGVFSRLSAVSRQMSAMETTPDPFSSVPLWLNLRATTETQRHREE